MSDIDIVKTSNIKSQYNITGIMNIEDDIQRKTDEFLKLIEPIPKQLSAVRKIAKKQAIIDRRYMSNEERNIKDIRSMFNENKQLKNQLKELRQQKSKFVSQLRAEIKENKYKNKETKQLLREQKKQILKQIKQNPISIKNKEKYEVKKRRNNAAKLIQKNWKTILENRKQYSVKVILYRSYSLDDPELYKGMDKGNIEAVKEKYRRKKLNSFLKMLQYLGQVIIITPLNSVCLYNYHTQHQYL